MGDTVELVRPYLERALRDEEFRKDLKDALGAARELYGPLAKKNGVERLARVLATDKKTQEQLRRALEDLSSAKDTLQGKKKKKGHKGRNMVLLAGVIAGALYNPWTGPQTREKLLDMIAGNDDLQPLERFDAVAAPVADAVADDGGGRRGHGGRRQGEGLEGRGELGGRRVYGPAPERASPPASARFSAPGTRPLAAEMSSASRSTAPACAEATGAPGGPARPSRPRT